MILGNRKKIYFIDNNIEERNESSYKLIFGHLLKQPYYYIEFKLLLQKLPDILPKDILVDLINKKIHLVLVNSHEAFHSVINEIYDVAVIKLRIPPDNITLLSESADIHLEINRVSRLRNLPEIKAIWVHLFENMIQSELKYKTFLHDNLPKEKYPRAFLNFNRRWRLHRPTLVALFHSLGIMDKGYISLGKTVENVTWREVWGGIIYQNKNTPEVMNLLLPNKEKICDLQPMYLDTTDLIFNTVNLNPDHQYLYLDSYFSVVSETNFYKSQNSGRFLSEKIFKPIAMCHPFIVASIPGILPLLRELGYKTFSPWINESYDEETDDNLRLLMIAKETERLANLNDKEIIDFVNNVRDICIHNRTTLLSKTIFHKRLN
jgi:hypothetical protein